MEQKLITDFEKIDLVQFFYKTYGLGLSEKRRAMIRLGLRSLNSNDQMVQLRILKFFKKRFVGSELQFLRGKERIELNRLPIYRIFRFKNGMPCNGQRTQTNANTPKRMNGVWPHLGDNKRNQKIKKKFNQLKKKNLLSSLIFTVFLLDDQKNCCENQQKNSKHSG